MLIARVPWANLTKFVVSIRGSVVNLAEDVVGIASHEPKMLFIM